MIHSDIGRRAPGPVSHSYLPPEGRGPRVHSPPPTDALAFDGPVVIVQWAEIGSSDNGVDVARNVAGGHDRIEPSGREQSVRDDEEAARQQIVLDMKDGPAGWTWVHN